MPILLLRTGSCDHPQPTHVRRLLVVGCRCDRLAGVPATGRQVVSVTVLKQPLKHKLGTSIVDCVVNSAVLTGISMICGKCRQGCVIHLPRAQFTMPTDLIGKTFFCPYCGAEGG